jgi:hypothetical protein
MADYAKHFKDLKLWKELGKSAGRDGLDAEEAPGPVAAADR